VRRNLEAAVREAVWLWDPYGVADDRSVVPEEYNDVVDFVLRNLRSVGSRQGLEAWVGAYLDDLGLRHHTPTDQAFVESVWLAWDDQAAGR
jgi:hypothetical protein